MEFFGSAKLDRYKGKTGIDNAGIDRVDCTLNLVYIIIICFVYNFLIHIFCRGILMPE